MTQTCDRCYQPAPVVIPWTKDLTTGRVLMRCCLDCEREMTVRALIVVGPGEEDEAAEAWEATGLPVQGGGDVRVTWNENPALGSTGIFTDEKP